MRGITKIYPGVRALDNVSFSVEQGEIHSLLGENGAGKSTLMNVLYGMTTPDAGEILVDGKPVTIRRSAQAIALGIGMVHQHFMLTPVMTITENVIVGCEPVHGPFLDRKKATESVQALIDKFHFHLNASARVQALSVGEQQRVEILKALYRGANVLILDEPTAVLTPQEVGELFSVLRELKAAGKSIIIITHKLRETAEIADRVSVLRAGVMVDQGLSAAGCSASDLALMMVGRKVDLSYTRRSKSVGETAYQVQNLNLTVKGVPILRDVALEVHKGEILGIAGIEGNGQSELIEVLTGLRKPDSMELVKDGLPLSGKTAAFLSAGVGHIPEDRLVRGMIGPMTIEDNIILGYHRKKEFSRHGIRRKNEIRAFSEKQLTDYQIKAPNVQEKCGSLSGGNQQKVVVARVFSEDPDVLIAAQPTRGVDVGAQELIHSRLLDLRDAGKAVLLISADLDEVRRLSDRIAVIYEGQIVAQGSYDTWNEMELGLLMAGEKAEKEARP
ncbi:MAG: ABC transporter ATP-binding protein [Candidatus Faecousia sp.]|nr:ABC transporter ATP-binding protein [Clostridiales bacterium]MDY2810279.1 ABC transporter ATP-binding protein [Candidatus Faecousia sp.]